MNLFFLFLFNLYIYIKHVYKVWWCKYPKYFKRRKHLYININIWWL
jgi:hypothetical protein